MLFSPAFSSPSSLLPGAADSFAARAAMRGGGAKRTPAEEERRGAAAARRARMAVKTGSFGPGAGEGAGLRKEYGRAGSAEAPRKEKRRMRLPPSSERRGEAGALLSREEEDIDVRSSDAPLRVLAEEMEFTAECGRWAAAFFLEKKERMPGRKVLFWRDLGDNSGGEVDGDRLGWVAIVEWRGFGGGRCSCTPELKRKCCSSRSDR
jgi:hypothetical protein